MLRFIRRTTIADDPCISAYRIVIYGVIDHTVSDFRFLHTANNLFKCFKILKRITIHLDITDMSRVGKCMIRSPLLNLFPCCRVIISPSSTVSVILPVSSLSVPPQLFTAFQIALEIFVLSYLTMRPSLFIIV